MQLPSTSSMSAMPRGGIIRYAVVAILVILVVGWIKFSPQLPPIPTYAPAVDKQHGSPSSPDQDKQAVAPGGSPPQSPQPPHEPAPPVVHPIETLINAAEDDFNNLLKEETHDVRAAAAAYRARRGRHPPPGFEAWFNFAKENGAVMVEEFFDQIYHDTAPFWAIDPHKLRLEAKNFEMTINIRNGNATTGSAWFWTKIWLDLIKTIEQYLPDMDLALNAMDEPRLLVPWEDINDYMTEADKTRQMPPPNEVSNKFHGLEEFDKEKPQPLNDKWDRKYPYFPKARVGCRPDDAARTADLQEDWSRDPRLSMQYARPHTYRGYVSNWTLSTSYCHQPDLQSLHGMFIEPLSVRSSDHLMPMFGGSKLATNNEILLPAPMYWRNDARFSGGDDHGIPWEDKKDAVIWRGAATGGRNKVGNWQGFQRQRFVSMVNATQVGRAEDWTEIPRNFELPPRFYDLKASRRSHMSEWLESFSDVSLVDLVCFPAEDNGDCSYSRPWFSKAKGMPMNEQFHNKYLPDLDGNSFSGRYRGFLMSNSLPIKATIFKEWHDSRIVPWKHFVPMDNRFQDFYGIMEYFLGYKGYDPEDHSNVVQGHDEAARKISQDGQDWANKVLRREDMQIYVFRVLLEYARISDDNRLNLGYVDDILSSQTNDDMEEDLPKEQEKATTDSKEKPSKEQKQKSPSKDSKESKDASKDSKKKQITG
ncbi:MAG: hypothetical protein M4579_006609 [Chaenotheca gracillima]|nr:MAG: hypothetical protein M4579_006609 [Chaenotheca gracillima]